MEVPWYLIRLLSCFSRVFNEGKSMKNTEFCHVGLSYLVVNKWTWSGLHVDPASPWISFLCFQYHANLGNFCHFRLLKILSCSSCPNSNTRPFFASIFPSRATRALRVQISSLIEKLGENEKRPLCHVEYHSVVQRADYRDPRRNWQLATWAAKWKVTKLTFCIVVSRVSCARGFMTLVPQI